MHALVAAVLVTLTACVLFFTAFAVLLLQLLTLAEGAERACPKIGNLTTSVFPFKSPFANEARLVLTASFNKIEQSACACTVHEVIRGRLRLTAKVKTCEHHGADNKFGGEQVYRAKSAAVADALFSTPPKSSLAIIPSYLQSEISSIY